jgi:mRNA interferase MazF
VVAPRPGVVVLVRFPFSDLSAVKLRPAVVLAAAGGSDWILCQVTSNPYGDARAVRLSDSDFQEGGLARESYARPAKLFTASNAIFVRAAGRLSEASCRRLIEAVMNVFSSSRD